MGENKSNLVGILAIILATSALGLGSYIFISVFIVEDFQGSPGQDGVDGLDGIDGIDGVNGTNGSPGADGMDAPGYYCVSALELQQTLDSIGAESGKITITNDITLYGPINISGGGTYIIQGQTPDITINSGGDWSTFNVTNARYCKFQNLKLNVSALTTNSMEIINTYEINDNPVYIENIQFLGDSDRCGIGVYILSDKVSIRNCYMNQLYVAIFQPENGGNNTIISDNFISDCYYYAIRLYGDYNNINNNLLNNTRMGIRLDTSNNNTIIGNRLHSIYDGNGLILASMCRDTIISENYISDIFNHGIDVVGDCVIISGNHISQVQFNGIHISDSSGKRLIISENVISYCYRGIYSYRPYVSITGNLISNTTFSGITILSSGDYSIISGNMITNLNANTGSNRSGIYIDSDYCTISENGIYSCHNQNPSFYGIGIWIGSSASYCIVDSNVCFDTDLSFYVSSSASSTIIGDDMNNIFP